MNTARNSCEILILPYSTSHLCGLNDESHQNHTSIKSDIEANNASITQSLQTVETHIGSLDQTTTALKQNVETLETRTRNLEHDQGHIASDLHALEAKVTVLHSSTAVSVIQGNKYIYFHCL